MTAQLYLPARLSTRAATAADRDRIGVFLTEMLAEFDLGLDHYGTDSDIVGLPGSYEEGYFGIVEDGAEIVGTFALYPLEDSRAEVRKMYLAPSLRGQGIGKRMLNFILELAAEKGFRHLELQTASAMEVARAVYEQAGFREIGAGGKSPRCDRTYYKRLYG